MPASLPVPGPLPAPAASCTAVVLADGLVPHLASSATDQLVVAGLLVAVAVWRWRLERRR